MSYSDWLDEILEEDGFDIKEIPDELWDKIRDLSDEMEESIVQDHQEEIKREVMSAFGDKLEKFRRTKA